MTTVWSRENLLDEIEHLRLLGIPAQDWPSDLGMTQEALSRALYRAGEAELARPFVRAAWHDRTKRLSPLPCENCGGPKVAANKRYCSQICYHANGLVGR